MLTSDQVLLVEPEGTTPEVKLEVGAKFFVMKLAAQLCTSMLNKKLSVCEDQVQRTHL